jgi:hypothetical protein
VRCSGSHIDGQSGNQTSCVGKREGQSVGALENGETPKGGACYRRSEHGTASAGAHVASVHAQARSCWNAGTANRVGNSVGTSCRAQKFGDRPGMAAAELLDVNGVCGNPDKANRDSDSVGTSCRAQKFGDRPGVVSAEFPEGWKSFC